MKLFRNTNSLELDIHRKRDSFISLLARALCNLVKNLSEHNALLGGQLVEESVASIHFGLQLGPLDISLVELGLDLGVASDELLDSFVLVVAFAWDCIVNMSGIFDIGCLGLRIT